jgi:membrane protease YdiL (CAAX protease family)
MPSRNPSPVAFLAADQTASPSRKEQLLEVLVFLALIVPSMAFSFLLIRQGGVGFLLTASATILRDLSLVALIAFFLWRNRESIARIGWRAAGLAEEFFLGILLFVPMTLGAGLLERLTHAAGLSSPSTPLPSFLSASGWRQFVLAAVLVIVVAIAEETIFRGYLILRFSAITRSPAAAVVLSTVVFTLGHGYEGAAGLVTVGAMGLAFALVYLWRGSLVAPIVMHFLQDFLAIVALPLLAHKH